MTAPPFPGQPLRGEGTVLRRLGEEDLPAVVRGVRDPIVLRFTNIPPEQTDEETAAWVARRAEAWETGEELAFAIASPEDDALLGVISLLRIDWAQRRAEIGYWVGEWARGRGAASAAVRLIADWAFAATALERLELRIDVANEASLGVARRAGFAHEGVLRSYEERLGNRRDVAVFSRLRGDQVASA